MDDIEQLIEKANLIESQSERLKFVMDYFLDTVQYDYAYLVAVGYMQESISEVYPFEIEKDVIINPFKKGNSVLTINGEPKEMDDSFCKTRRISKGESKLFNKIVELQSECNGDKEIFINELEEILKDVLIEHLDNEELVKLNISNLVSKIKKDISCGSIASSLDKTYFIPYDIKSVLITYLLVPNINFPPKIENGILKRGVCQHYANYLQDLLPKLGIDAIRIDGTSELGHAWIAAVVDGKVKSVDLTRAIFIKDGFKNIPSNQKSSDWLISNFEDTFKMQKTRTITSVGMDDNGPIKLETIVNVDNYDEDYLKDIIIKRINDRKIKNRM